ncbi:pantoate-beta-alanine ligase [Dimargaris verticillata]|uniref:Pantoate--beta-alanine ligase n=1 Tax=Dimargaris verticillata TaxID=2761393 RepID=A0A9W8B9C1_9FUNG|nr:pantoate-beta-alanine ligase [Dimargaris verticillata]
MAPTSADTDAGSLNRPLVLHTTSQVHAWRRQQTKLDRTVGFVPTMGALHRGHLELVRRARAQCDSVVVSIFVNPSQFAPHEDLDQYPRDLDTDLAKLSAPATMAETQTATTVTTTAPNMSSQARSSQPPARPLADMVFVPSVCEMYPSGITLNRAEQRGTFVEVLGKSHQMEGITRPHFFRGVATVVNKFFNIVVPDYAYFGQKDAQQCVVVKSMVRDLCLPIKVVVVPTVRDHQRHHDINDRSSDGLALSSRNKYLTSPDQRRQATTLYRALTAAAALYRPAGDNSHASATRTTDRESLLTAARKVFEDEPSPEVQLEYLSLAHPDTLEELDAVGADGAILSGAFRVGQTRLIDNILLNCTL